MTCTVCVLRCCNGNRAACCIGYGYLRVGVVSINGINAAIVCNSHVITCFNIRHVRIYLNIAICTHRNRGALT